MKRIIFFILICISLSLHAQVEYASNRLKINCTDNYSHFNLLVNNWNGMHWRNGDVTFNLDLIKEAPSLAGNNDAIFLLNQTNRHYNSLFLAKFYLASDGRAKKDIATLKSGLESVMQLRPVTYHWKQDENQTESLSETPEKVDNSIMYGPASETQLQYGFLAQEVEKVIPAAVKTTESGDKLIDYIALIPMLVQSVQELQATAEAQAITIERLTSTLPADKVTLSNNRILGCSPNPTTGQTTVSLQIEPNVNRASIIITSLAGMREKSFDISPKDTEADIDISALKTGIHIASLYVDDKLADSCRLAKE